MTTISVPVTLLKDLINSCEDPETIKVAEELLPKPERRIKRLIRALKLGPDPEMSVPGKLMACRVAMQKAAVALQDYDEALAPFAKLSETRFAGSYFADKTDDTAVHFNHQYQVAVTIADYTRAEKVYNHARTAPDFKKKVRVDWGK
jgi:hypothetical protein